MKAGDSIRVQVGIRRSNWRQWSDGGHLLDVPVFVVALILRVKTALANPEGCDGVGVK